MEKDFRRHEWAKYNSSHRAACTLSRTAPAYARLAPREFVRRAKRIDDFGVFHMKSLSVLKEVKGRNRSKPATRLPSLVAFGNPVVGAEVVNDLRDQQSGDRFDPSPEAEADVKALAEFFDPNQSRILRNAGDHEPQAQRRSGLSFGLRHCKRKDRRG